MERDLTQFPPRKLAALIETDRVDVIVGGPPCQGFSTARQRDGANHGDRRFVEDPRRQLYREFLRYVAHFQPRVFVIENVLGIKTAAGGAYFTRVQHEARALGYRVHGQVEDAYELGVPQKRKRQLIVGVQEKISGYFPKDLAPAKRAVAGTNLGAAIGDLPAVVAGGGEEECAYDFARRERHLDTLGSSARNYLYRVLEAARAKRLTAHRARPHSARDLRDFALLREGQNSAEAMRAGVVFEFPYDKGSFKDRYTRQSRREPCSTIVAHLSKDGLMFIHPTQNRSLTPREAARVQSFPDWFVFPVPRTHQFRVIGNAVPPLVAEAVGEEVKAFLARAEREDTRTHKAAHPRPVTPDFPRDARQASERLLILARSTRRELRALPAPDFRRGWHALIFLYPELHPDSALDHGDDRFDLAPPVPEAAAWRERYTRSGWPVALELIGREAWRRYEANELSDDDFYCVGAQHAGIRHLQRAQAKV